MFSIRPGKRLAANRCVRMMRLPFTLCLLALAMQVHATVVDTRFNPQFNPLFDDHAVLQRDRPIRVWGSAPPGEGATVTLGSATAPATANTSGLWTATLPAMPAGGPHDLTVRFSHGHSQVAHDILIGDVYLCSGQSNMVLEVHRSLNTRVEILEANNDSIRMLKVPLTTSLTPLDRFAAPVEWLPTTSDTVFDSRHVMSLRWRCELGNPAHVGNQR
jgi:sialate O-acetylesterase